MTIADIGSYVWIAPAGLIVVFVLVALVTQSRTPRDTLDGVNAHAPGPSDSRSENPPDDPAQDDAPEA